MGYNFDGILRDIEVHKVGEGRIGCKSSSIRGPCIWMLGFEY
jgi:hypothetical protein